MNNPIDEYGVNKPIIFLVLNGFISAFLLIFMANYFASERFMKVELSSDVFIGTVVLLAILSSIGFVFTARKQSIGRIWSAFGIEIASAILFVIADLVLKTFRISINFFAVSADDNPALGLLIVIFGMMFIALRFYTARGNEIAKERQKTAVSFYEDMKREVSDSYDKGMDLLNKIIR